MKPIIIQSIFVLVDFLMIVTVVNFFLNSQLRKKLADNETPSAIYILKASCAIVAGIFSISIYKPLTETESLLGQTGEGGLFNQLFYYHSMYLIISISGIVLAGLLTLLVFRLTSQERLLMAVKTDSRYTAIYFGILLIMAALVLQGSTDMFMSEFIPFPEIKGGFN